MIEVLIAISVYLAWSVGVHTLGSITGMAVGGGLLRLKPALAVAGAFGILGIYFFSKEIIKTLGTELVKLDAGGHVAVLVSMGIVITFLAWRGLPVSTGYVAVGSLAGYSILHSAYFNFLLFEKILVAFLTSPIAAIAVAFLIYTAIKKLWLAKIKSIPKIEKFETQFYVPAVLGFIVMAVALGANSVGVVVGILGDLYAHSTLATIGSIGFVLGLSTWSYKIAKTMGIKMTDLSPSRSFAAMLGAGLVILGFVSFGIPVSTSQTLIGGVMGVALARKKMERNVMRKIIYAWAFALPVSFVLAGLVGWLM